MILKRVEVTLIGPDKYPTDEGSLAEWEAKENYARALLESELEWFLFRARRKLFDPEFDLEIEGSERSGGFAPSNPPDDSVD